MAQVERSGTASVTVNSGRRVELAMALEELRKRFQFVGWPEFWDSRTFIVIGFGAGIAGGCLS
jgi:hypothetical protein